MKKSKMSLIFAVLFMFSMSVATAFSGGQDDSVLSQHVKEADGTSGQNTNSGSGIKTGHIQDGAITTPKIADGAVTDAKITGPISASKISSTGRKVIIVSKGGNEDFADPVAAMNSITDASVDNPYLLKIMPGVYDLGGNNLSMKSYVDIEGSGENITTIKGTVPGQDGIRKGLIEGASNAEIRYLTIQNIVGTEEYSVAAILNYWTSSAKMTNLTITATGARMAYGIYNHQTAYSAITNVTVAANGGVTSWGINNLWNTGTVMTNVIATASGGTSHNYGIENSSNSCANATMRNVTAYGEGGSVNIGVHNSSSLTTMTDVTANATGGFSYGVQNDVVFGGCTVKINNSVINGATNTINNMSQTTYISNTKLDGGPISNYNGIVKCIGAYDGNYDAYSCP